MISQAGQEGFYGWIHNPVAVQAVMATLPMPSFAQAAPHLAGTGEDKDVLLYLIHRKVTGQDAPKGPQGIGDCVSWGWACLCNYVQAVEISKGTLEEYKETATEAIYALSRVEIGGERGSYQDGSVGAWAAKAVSTYGTLARELVGPYDPKRAKEWGAKGLTSDLESKSKDHPVKTVSQVKSFAEARDAITNGYPVAVCSSQGFTMERDKDGFCSPKGRWDHCMCFVGVRAGSRPGLCCAQSWGPNTPQGPLGLDQPDNTFWVDQSVADSMLAKEDSFTGSAFQGYPAKDLLDYRF